VQYAWERSPFYRRKWEQAGVSPESLKSLDDLARFPVVQKSELRAAQAASPPFGDYLCIEPREVARIHGTSGTTGRPTVFGIGRDDWGRIGEAHARILWGAGVRPDDRVMICSFFSLYLGSWGALVGGERLGAMMFPFGAGVAGQTLMAVAWARDLRPTAFYSTPSYALHLADTARKEGVDPRHFGLRLLFFSGEPGASVPAIRGRIEELYGGRVFDCGSMAEMTPWMHLGESAARVGMLCWQDIVYTEVVDANTLARVPYGREGTPVYTHLERLSQPMIRLLSNDLTRWEAGPTPDGRTYPFLPRGIYGRIDDMFTVRGENIYPSAIDEIVMALDGYGGEHRILVSRDRAMDELTVQVEHAPGADGDGLRRRAEAELRRVLGVGARVLAVPPGTLDRTEFKARRVVDAREVLRR
jgi:phenylacetate-CoA ligase